jgi:hypothetical protein
MLYTACKVGLGAGPGFQTQSASPGLDMADRLELEELPKYHYPRRLSVKPSPQEIQRLCPPRFQLTYLSSGRAAVTRTGYAGEDYSGRTGNYIAHSLIFPPRSDIWPIDLMRWDQWRETAASEPPTLNPIAPAALKCDASSLDYPALSSFVRQGDRCQQLATMIDALLASRKTNRPLVIRDELHVLQIWLACLTKVLPRNLTRPFTFASFVNEAIANADIQCTTPDSDFEITAEKLRYDIFVFDFADRRFSEIESPKDGAGHLLASWLRDAPHNFGAFHDFASRFSFEAGSGSLLNLLNCYLLAEDEAFELPKSEGQLVLAFSFAGTALGGDADGRSVIERLVERCKQFTKKNPMARLVVAQGLQGLASDATNRGFVELAWRSCVELLHNELADGARQWKPLKSAIEQIACDKGVPAADVQAALLRPDKMAMIASSHQAAPEDMEQFLSFLAACVGKSAMPSAGNETSLRDVVSSLAKTVGLAAIVGPLLKVTARLEGARAFGEMCLELSADKSDAVRLAIGREIMETLDGDLAIEAKNVRRTLVSRGRLDLLLAELECRGVSVDANVRGFLGNLEFLHWAMPRRQRSHLGQVVATGWRNASPESRSEMADWLLNHSDLVSHLDPIVVGEIVAKLGASLRIDDNSRGASSHAKMLARICRSTGTPLPIQLALRGLLDTLHRGRFKTLSDVRAAWDPIEPRVDDQLGRVVVSESLGTLLMMCEKPQDHCWALEWARELSGEPHALRIYANVLQSKWFAAADPKPAEAFVVAAFSASSSRTLPESFGRCADDHLDAWLCSLSGKTFAALNEFVASHRKQLSVGARVEQADLTRRSLLGRLSRFLRGIF